MTLANFWAQIVTRWVEAQNLSLLTSPRFIDKILRLKIL